VTHSFLRPGWLWCALVALGLPCAVSGAPRSSPRASGDAHVNGARLYYEVYGQGAPLVFLHAGLADRRMWDDQVDYFVDHHTVVRFDARGYGKSEAPAEPYIPADDLYLLLRFLGIDRACIIGLSMGATLAFDYAVAHPEAVSALVVVAGSPGWQPFSDGLIRRTSTYLAVGREKGPSTLVEGWLNDPMLAAAKTQPRVAQQMRMFISENAAGLLATSLMRPPNIPQPNLLDLHVPTLIMVGNRDDREIVERAHAMRRDIPGAQEVVVKGAGHMVNLEKPGEFNRALARFVNRVFP
jgi:pimeloyl-ACP methyl ester carboxylesterase